MIESLINRNTKELEDLLVKIGISQGSAATLAPFMSSLAAAYEGLLSKGIPESSAQDIYNTVVSGFMASHLDIQKEFQDLRNDPQKLEKALKAVLEAVSQNVLKAAEAIKESGDSSPPSATLH